MDILELLITYGWVILIFFTLSVIATEALIGWGLDTGVGEQSGYIAEIEASGIFWRPPEVRLLNIITTLQKGDTSWHYGIEPSLLETAKKYQKTKTLVKVRYEVRRFTWRWDYANRIVIVDIEPLEVESGR